MSLASIRLDRFATLYVAQPLLSAGAQKTARLPILMYHSISDTPEAGVRAYYQTVTHPEVFKRHMNGLREAGWRGVTLRDGLTSLSQGPAQVEKAVAITFDDGFEDFYTAAFPVLRENDFSATMYLPTAHIGDMSRAFKGQPCMTWPQVEELHRHGIEFGSHSVSHPKLWDLSWMQIATELRDSKREIEDKLGVAVPSFAYPYAFPQRDRSFSSRFRTELENAHYENCVTTVIGRVAAEDDLYTLKRLPANCCDDLALLEAKLRGAYDWLAWAQTAVKTVKTALRSECRNRSDI
jgi:peptidoglycan/xylan/chitin deacetylase (PgdA/CDA1 family)